MNKLFGLLVSIVLLGGACSSSGTATVTDVGDGAGSTTIESTTTDDSTNTGGAAADLCDFLETSREQLSADDSTDDDASAFLNGLADRLPDDLSDEADDLRIMANAPSDPAAASEASDASFEVVETYAIARCNLDADFFSSDFGRDSASGDSGDFGGSDDRGDTFGDNPELDALWTSCEAGDDADCDTLFWTSPIDSGYEEFGQNCGGRERQGITSCEADDDTDFGDGADVYGDDPTLDALYDSCKEGDDEDCDTLYLTSPIGSEYEEFGDTCGGRVPGGAGSCASDSEASGDTFGDNPVLDALWTKCDEGDNDACDELYFDSPFGSEYEEFGDTCGGRNGQDTDGYCGTPE